MIEQLDQYKASVLPDSYPPDVRYFYSPVDRVHEALKEVLGWAAHSLVIAMYGYDDPELDQLIQSKCASPDIFVSLSLDKSQSAGKHEAELLAEWNATVRGTDIVIGHSEKGAIQHLKAAVVDGLYIIGGSTNWSQSGETLQDNQLIIQENAVIAAELQARILCIHDGMKKQMES